MIVGLGIDILSLARFREFVLRRGAAKVAKRVCSSGELERFEKIGSTLAGSGASSTGSTGGGAGTGGVKGPEDLLDKQVRFLSTRWSIKEAAYKAISPLLSRPPSFKTFELSHSPAGQPRLNIVASEAKGRYSLMTTLSHDAGVVVGVVIAMEAQAGLGGTSHANP
ncbi:hypothetical protein IAT38_007068 [Cryptococcus sp. DSM 104549]